MGGEHDFQLALTRDVIGSTLRTVDFQSFSRYDYVSRATLAEMTGEILLEESFRLIGDAAIRAGRGE